MKIFLTGVKRSHGIGKESKNAYDMHEAQILVRIEIGKMGGMTVEGAGFEGTTMPVSADAMHAIATLKMPGVFDLECEQRMFRGEATTTIVGVAALAKAA